MATSIIVHERIGEWTGRLRPRFVESPTIQWVESRSVGDLVAGVSRHDHSIALINLSNRPYWGLESLEALHQVAPDALTLVLDPDRTADVSLLARELGATLVWSGVVVPPRVEVLFRRWLTILNHRQAPAQSQQR